MQRFMLIVSRHEDKTADESCLYAHERERE